MLRRTGGESPRAAEEENARPDAPVVLPGLSNGRYVGLALYYPALEAIGLLKAVSRTASQPSAWMGASSSPAATWPSAWVHENTVQRWARQGLPKILDAKPRPKGPLKATSVVGERIEEARQQGLNGPETRAWLLEQFGIALSISLVHAVRQELARADVNQTALPVGEKARAKAGTGQREHRSE